MYHYLVSYVNFFAFKIHFCICKEIVIFISSGTEIVILHAVDVCTLGSIRLYRLYSWVDCIDLSCSYVVCCIISTFQQYDVSEVSEIRLKNNQIAFETVGDFLLNTWLNSGWLYRARPNTCRCCRDVDERRLNYTTEPFKNLKGLNTLSCVIRAPLLLNYLLYIDLFSC